VTIGGYRDAILAAIFFGGGQEGWRQIAANFGLADVDLDIVGHLQLIAALEKLGHTERQKGFVLLPVGHRDFGSRGWRRALALRLSQELLEVADVGG